MFHLAAGGGGGGGKYERERGQVLDYCRPTGGFLPWPLPKGKAKVLILPR